VTVAIWILSALLVAEFVMAPVNLWTGRTMPTRTIPGPVPVAGLGQLI
jgi:hypothetical protein